MTAPRIANRLPSVHTLIRVAFGANRSQIAWVVGITKTGRIKVVSWNASQEKWGDNIRTIPAGDYMNDEPADGMSYWTAPPPMSGDAKAPNPREFVSMVDPTDLRRSIRLVQDALALATTIADRMSEQHSGTDAAPEFFNLARSIAAMGDSSGGYLRPLYTIALHAQPAKAPSVGSLSKRNRRNPQ